MGVHLGDDPDHELVIKVRDLVVGFGERNVIDGFDLDVRKGEILGVVGPSGAGKSVTLRAVIGLLPKKAGTVEVFGADMDRATEAERLSIEQRWGALQIAAGAKREVPTSTHASPLQALAAAMEVADPADRIVVFGSFYTVGGVLQQGVPRLQAKHLGA